jgi:hypothetical protein
MIIYGVWAALKYLTYSKIYWSLADLIYWTGLMIGPFALADSFRCIVTMELMGNGN